MYLHADGNLGRDIDYQVACTKFGPKSAIGGLTALFHYGLIEQVPGQVWVLVPPNQITHARLYRLIRTKINPDRGIINENGYRIVSVERAVLEGLKMAKEIGLDSVLTRYFEVITT